MLGSSMPAVVPDNVSVIDSFCPAPTVARLMASADALVLHDVAPSTAANYRPFVQAVDAIGGVPITWLVVPDFHDDREPAPTTPRDWFMCRGLAKIVSDQREQQWRDAPVIRLGLHPVDLRHAFSREYWLHTLERLLAEGRKPMNKIDWLIQQRERMGRAA
jgi:predicted deacetylase